MTSTTTQSATAVGRGSAQFVFGYVADLAAVEDHAAVTLGTRYPTLAPFGPNRLATRQALASAQSTLAHALVAAGIR